MSAPAITPDVPLPRRRRLHASTWFVVALALVAWLLAEVPARIEGRYDAGVFLGGYWEDQSSQFEHGWPLTFLVRENGQNSIDDYEHWRITRDVEEIRAGALVADILLGLAGLLAIGWCYERWRRSRTRLLRITLRETLLVTLLAAMVCGWSIERYRRAPGCARR